MTQQKFELPKFVCSRDGKQKGEVISSRCCRQVEGCTGLQLCVRWTGADGKKSRTWPCTKGMDATKDPDTWIIL